MIMIDFQANALAALISTDQQIIDVIHSASSSSLPSYHHHGWQKAQEESTLQMLSLQGQSMHGTWCNAAWANGSPNHSGFASVR